MATEQPYNQVSRVFETIFGLRQLTDSLERMSRRLSPDAEDFCWSRPVPPAKEEGELFVESADGKGVPDVGNWIGRLIEWNVVNQSGRTKGTRYFVNPVLLKTLTFQSPTDLRRIEPHRLRELVREDLSRHPGSLSSEIQERIGQEIGLHRIRDVLKSLMEAGKVRYEGERRWRKYWQTDVSDK